MHARHLRRRLSLLRLDKRIQCLSDDDPLLVGGGLSKLSGEGGGTAGGVGLLSDGLSLVSHVWVPPRVAPAHLLGSPVPVPCIIGTKYCCGMTPPAGTPPGPRIIVGY